MKHQIGKLTLRVPADEYINSSRIAHRIENLDLELPVVSHLLSLPPYHRDPFDRMLICQALHHNLTMVTTDDKFQHYPLTVL